MQCNIDEEGARMRKTWGIMVLLAGIVLAGLALWSGTWWLWLIVGGCVAAGSFALYEAHHRWCALRAMGIKTPQ